MGWTIENAVGQAIERIYGNKDAGRDWSGKRF
jgi:hypothetical protein